MGLENFGSFDLFYSPGMVANLNRIPLMIPELQIPAQKATADKAAGLPHYFLE